MSVEIKLSAHQQEILETITKWFTKKDRQYLTLGGFAGTGKSTIVAHLRSRLAKDYPDLKVAFCAYTGKASRVLEQKLREQKVFRHRDFVGTIHSLIYSPVLNSQQEIIAWKLREREGFDFELLIVDEASMLNSQLWSDLLQLGVPILAVGDHGQLPPIDGKFNLMENPELVLTEIFRQAEDNPIIHLSILARENGQIPVGKYGPGVIKYDRSNSEMGEMLAEKFSSKAERLVLCGYNHTRIRLNKAIRQAREIYEARPVAGDIVVCLRNNHAKKIYNGMVGKIVSIEIDKEKDIADAKIVFPDTGEEYNGQIWLKQFDLINSTEVPPSGLDLFDFGYALTVHKAQGSQAEEVILFEERFSKMDDDTWKKWLYTGVTRASERLIVVG